MFVYYKTLFNYMYIKVQNNYLQTSKTKRNLTNLCKLRHTSLPNVNVHVDEYTVSQDDFHLWNRNDNSEDPSSPATPLWSEWSEFTVTQLFEFKGAQDQIPVLSNIQNWWWWMIHMSRRRRTILSIIRQSALGFPVI